MIIVHKCEMFYVGAQASTVQRYEGTRRIECEMKAKGRERAAPRSFVVCVEAPGGCPLRPGYTVRGWQLEQGRFTHRLSVEHNIRPRS